MYYPQEVLDEVLANTDIVDVISAHVHLKKQGRDYMGLCPFHNEKTPSFHVSQEKQYFHCFGCGEGGNAFTFLMKYNNAPFQEVVKELADRAQIALPEADRSEESKQREEHRQALFAVNKEAATYYYRLLRSRKGERGMRYFADRGLTPETMQMFGLGFADGARSDLTAYLRTKGFSDDLLLESSVSVFNEKQGIHDRYWNRVMFPIQDVRGRVIGFGGRVLGEGLPKYINSSDTQIFDKGRNLYALNLARRSKKDHLILCEGYMDVIAMHQAGFPEAVASLGTAFTPGQAALLKRYTGKILLAYDSDAAGVRAALRNIRILRSGGLETSVIDLRPHKDPDEFLKAEGQEAFRERIERAENSFFYELRILSQSYRMDDPAGRTAFHREIARKLCAFSDEIERENYTIAAAEKYFINADSLRRLVAQYGNATGYGTETDSRRVRQNVRYDAAGKVLRSAGSTFSGSGRAGQDGIVDGMSRGPSDVTPAGSIPAGSGASPEEGGRTGAPQTSRRRAGRRISGTEAALLRKQSMLLTWSTDDPKVFGIIRRYLTPEDFQEGICRQTASCLWERMEKGTGTAVPASVISSFETQQEQAAAASLLSAHMEDIEDGAEKGKTLRELMTAVKEASLSRMAGQDKDPGASLQEFLSAKKALEALRTAKISI